MNHKTIILFRHGQTDSNAQGIAQGHLDIPLNEVGKQQAQELSKQLISGAIEIIVSSDLMRAHETATIAAADSQIPVTVQPALREINVGVMQGKPRLALFQSSIWNSWQQLDMPLYDNVGFEQGETRGQARTRVVTWFKEFIDKTEHHRIGICAHGRILQLLLHSLVGIDKVLDNTETIKLMYTKETKLFTLE